MCAAQQRAAQLEAQAEQARQRALQAASAAASSFSSRKHSRPHLSDKHLIGAVSTESASRDVSDAGAKHTSPREASEHSDEPGSIWQAQQKSATIYWQSLKCAASAADAQAAQFRADAEAARKRAQNVSTDTGQEQVRQAAMMAHAAQLQAAWDTQLQVAHNRQVSADELDGLLRSFRQSDLGIAHVDPSSPAASRALQRLATLHETTSQVLQDAQLALEQGSASRKAGLLGGRPAAADVQRILKNARAMLAKDASVLAQELNAESAHVRAKADKWRDALAAAQHIMADMHSQAAEKSTAAATAAQQAQDAVTQAQQLLAAGQEDQAGAATASQHQCQETAAQLTAEAAKLLSDADSQQAHVDATAEQLEHAQQLHLVLQQAQSKLAAQHAAALLQLVEHGQAVLGTPQHSVPLDGSTAESEQPRESIVQSLRREASIWRRRAGSGSQCSVPHLALSQSSKASLQV